MKKLVYIANARIPTEKAHGIQIMKMCDAFTAQGIDVELVLPRRLNNIKENPFDYYGVKKNFKITKLPTLDFIALELGQSGFFAETLIFLIASRIYLLFKNYDILYTREEWAGLFFKDFCMEVHSLPARPSLLHKKTWRKAKAIFVLTSFTKNELIKLGISENKILVLPDAVDLAKFDIRISKEEARKKLNLPQDKKNILYTGSFYLYDWKGVDVLLEAVKNFREDFLFMLVGGSEEEISNLKSYTINLKNLKLIGHKPYAEIPYYLKAADVLVLPNKKGSKISEEHTSPLKLFEYMASGRPIVASDLPSLREILTEKEALFFRSNDAADLVRAIKEILQDPTRAEQLAKNALQKVQNHTWSNRAHRAIDFINK
ncbi:MAG: Glycosyl transferase group 1 [Candidatus Giovannonibacteria bacterium GW2011_GWC2_44_9]|uniref:Glycosyl transferase group 1 n=3 Tax=Candidatus Giovannoniibacteriota TaxID=1752738 RepID=A0A0G1IZA8_9BACT|nr:MAG: Glycosyl transferase group 1 [Candidatus Giovannonibacteria bacterium GW2011_GWB1_44_23]KKT64353.1 MAG: Glycosyl transferase group 1 [Candidatus Giovannonibacteria bacterium GW2011_GWA1_44_29]KKT84307.1 MAG: Glycosyl transferase group 1 [Candidatus Giovannonibacteria bacterium GW2011_GWC2_44_9]KKT92080.1 MAG: Glycosyl transferase group 1 [Parcubacteria group bacterium GW2011_GWC1_45_13]